MFKSKQKNFFKRFIFSKIFLIAGIFVLVLLTVALAKKMVHDYSVESEIERLESEISELEKTNNEFNNLVEYLNTEKFLEEEARSKMGLASPGEEMIIIQNKNGDLANTREEEARDLSVYSSTYLTGGEPKELSNPQKWWNYFFSQNKNLNNN